MLPIRKSKIIIDLDNCKVANFTNKKSVHNSED